MPRGRVVLVLALLLSLLVPPQPAAAAPWTPRLAAAVEWAQGRAGEVSIAVIDPRRGTHRYQGGRNVPAASVLKVMFMVAYLRSESVRDRDLRESDRDLLGPMIRRSENDPATAIANMLGPRPMYRLANRVGMRDFSYTRPWGLSTTSARDQARFLYRIRRYIPDRHERYAMRLLRRVVASQRWGIGQVETDGWAKHFKGGWGSGSGAVEHQVVRLEAGGRKIGLAVTITSSPSHGYGKDTLRGVFRRLLRDLPQG